MALVCFGNKFPKHRSIKGCASGRTLSPRSQKRRKRSGYAVVACPYIDVLPSYGVILVALTSYSLPGMALVRFGNSFPKHRNGAFPGIGSFSFGPFGESLQWWLNSQYCCHRPQSGRTSVFRDLRSGHNRSSRARTSHSLRKSRNEAAFRYSIKCSRSSQLAPLCHSLGPAWCSLRITSPRFGISGADGECASSSSRRARSSNPETPKGCTSSQLSPQNQRPHFQADRFSEFAERMLQSQPVSDRRDWRGRSRSWHIPAPMPTFIHFIVFHNLGSARCSLCGTSPRFGISGADGKHASSSSRRGRSSNPETPNTGTPAADFPDRIT